MHQQDLFAVRLEADFPPWRPEKRLVHSRNVSLGPGERPIAQLAIALFAIGATAIVTIEAGAVVVIADDRRNRGPLESTQ